MLRLMFLLFAAAQANIGCVGSCDGAILMGIPTISHLWALYAHDAGYPEGGLEADGQGAQDPGTPCKLHAQYEVAQLVVVIGHKGTRRYDLTQLP